jgi:hypothetical protein
MTPPVRLQPGLPGGLNPGRIPGSTARQSGKILTVGARSVQEAGKPDEWGVGIMTASRAGIGMPAVDTIAWPGPAVGRTL